MKVVKNPDTDYVKTMKKRLKSNSGYCPNAFEKSLDTNACAENFEKWSKAALKDGAGADCISPFPRTTQRRNKYELQVFEHQYCQ